MTRSDIWTIAIIYATCALFCWMTLQLRPAAQIYPLCIIGGLALLNTLYLAKCLLRMGVALKEGQSAVRNDLPEIFKDFQAKQFFFVVGSCLGYLILLYYLGFYLAGFIYLVGSMWWLKVKQFQLWATVIVLGVLVYSVFTLFLKVPLPKGVLFG